MKNDEILLRIRELISEMGVSDGKFADKIKMDRSGFSKRMTGLVVAGEGFVNRIVLELGVNKQWLVDGIGERYPVKVVEPNHNAFSDFVSVPIVSANAHAEYLRSYHKDSYLSSLYSAPVKLGSEFSGNYRAFQVSGDAMSDGTYTSILSNDLVLGRLINTSVIYSALDTIKGKMFVIVYKGGIVLRKFISFDIVKKTAIFAASNPLYSDIIIDIDDIFELYSLTKIIDREV